METEGSILRSQGLATGPCPEQDDTGPHFTLFL